MRKTSWIVVKWIFFLSSMAFLAHYAVGIHRQHGNLPWLGTTVLLHAAMAAVLFALTAPVAASAWRILLTSLGHPTTFRSACSVLFRTQIAKYIPGNIGHHIGRVALAKVQLGIPATTTIASLMQESGLVVLSTTLAGVALVAMGAHSTLPENILGLPFPAALSIACVAPIAALAFCQYLKTSSLRMPAWAFRLLRLAPSPAAAAVVFAAYLVMNLFNCGAVAMLAGPLLGFDDGILVLAGAYLLSWSIGFLLPGAPGGLGVREASFLLLLEGLYPPDLLLALTIALRGATVMADILIFLAGAALGRRADA